MIASKRSFHGKNMKENENLEKGEDCNGDWLNVAKAKHNARVSNSTK